MVLSAFFGFCVRRGYLPKGWDELGRLAPIKVQREGEIEKVWKRGHQAFYHVQAETAQAAGIEWKHNALRHSFISYRFAETGEVAKTSFEAGNSPATVHRHYRQLVTAKAAKQWFGVKPSRAENVAVLKVA